MGIFSDKPMETYGVGGYDFDFYYHPDDPKRCYLDIKALSGIWGMRIGGNTHTYGYLLAAARQDLMEQLHGYAVIISTSSMAMTQNQGLTDDLTKSVVKYTKRVEKAAKAASDAITDEQDLADGLFMLDAIARGKDKSKKTKDLSRLEMRSILADDIEP